MAVPKKQKSLISYFFEDPRTFQLAGSLTTGMWAGLWEWSKIYANRRFANFRDRQSTIGLSTLCLELSSLFTSAHSEICSYVAFHVASFCLSSLLPSAYFLLPLISSFPHYLISSSSLLSFALSSPYSPTHSFTAAIISSVISRL